MSLMDYRGPGGGLERFHCMQGWIQRFAGGGGGGCTSEWARVSQNFCV